MKFICESCKAKYQIGDDKVAGKTVRMKCRRCGNMIVVSASVTTETSVVARIAPSGPPPAQEPPAVDAFAHTHVGDDDEERTMIMKPGALLPKSAPKPGASAAPKPAAGPAAAPRPGAPAPRPAGVTPIGAARSAGSPSPPRPASVSPLRPSTGAAAVARAPDAPPAPQGVAASFQQSLQSQDSSPQLRSSPAEDWYVGIGGVPVGPVRLVVIREKAAAGQVHADSLVWREGFEEWQPLKKFPELLELVEAAQRSLRRPTLGPASAETRPTPSPEAKAPETKPSETKPSETKPSDVKPIEPTPAAAAAAAAAALAATVPKVAEPEVAATKPEEPKAEALGVLSDPFAAPKPAPSKPVEAVTEAPKPEPQKAEPQKAEAALVALDPEPSVRRKKAVHPMAWAFVAMAAAFGGVAAYTLFLKPAETKVVVVEKSAAPGAATAAPTGEAKAADKPGEAGTAAPDPAGTGGPAKVASGGGTWSGGGGGAKPGDAKSASPAATFDNSGLATGPKVDGPAAVPTSGGGSSGGGSLTAAEIGSVVDKERPIIRRKCWQTALDARTNPNATSAKVNVSFTVGPSGSVSGVSASGGGDFPGLASCIQGKVAGWKFPASGGSQPVSVPFVFAAQ